MRKGKVKRMNGIAGYATAIFASILICLLVSFVLSELVLMKKIGEGALTFLIPIVLLLATIVGCELCCRLLQTRKVRTVITSSIIFAVLLLTAGLLIDGSFERVGHNMLGIAIGSLITCSNCLIKKGNSRNRNKGYR